MARLSVGKWLLIFDGAELFAWAPRMLALHLKPILWYNAYGNILIEYTSPTIVLAAVALLSVFTRLRLPSWAERTIVLLSPCAFGVYLLHAHPLVFRYILEGRFAHLGTEPIHRLLVAVPGWSLVICALGMASDWLLTQAMKCIRLDRLVKKLDKLI